MASWIYILHAFLNTKVNRVYARVDVRGRNSENFINSLSNITYTLLHKLLLRNEDGSHPHAAANAHTCDEHFPAILSGNI